MDQLTMGVIAKSRKADEFRLPIHPSHLARIAPELRSRMFFETGYGEKFGVSDHAVAGLVGGLRSREHLLGECDICVLPKPIADDLAELREGAVMWGWPHCVQDKAVTQVAIDRRLTLIAWEAMNHWTAGGEYLLHVFHKNNELAGYCSVLHAMRLTGRTGQYGRRLRAAVISFGATARGAVTALTALGILDVAVLTQRGVTAVASPIHSARLVHFDRDAQDPSHVVVIGNREPESLAKYLAEFDVVVNCVLQDTDAPLMFVSNEELRHFDAGTLFIDVSCDTGMGFEWARPTSFRAPILGVGAGAQYYAVDHSPSYLWDSATWEISDALLPYLGAVLGGPAAWDADQTLRRATEIRDGTVQNPKILSFQGRDLAFPHAQR